MNMVTLSVVVYIIGLIGLIANKKNIINTIICIEIMLLGINSLLISSSCYLDDIMGNIMYIYVLTVAGCEASIGLTLIIILYRRCKTTNVNIISLVKN